MHATGDGLYGGAFRPVDRECSTVPDPLARDRLETSFDSGLFHSAVAEHYRDSRLRHAGGPGHGCRTRLLHALYRCTTHLPGEPDVELDAAGDRPAAEPVPFARGLPLD